MVRILLIKDIHIGSILFSIALTMQYSGLAAFKLSIISDSEANTAKHNQLLSEFLNQ